MHTEIFRIEIGYALSCDPLIQLIDLTFRLIVIIFPPHSHSLSISLSHTHTHIHTHTTATVTMTTGLGQ